MQLLEHHKPGEVRRSPEIVVMHPRQEGGCPPHFLIRRFAQIPIRENVRTLLDLRNLKDGGEFPAPALIPSAILFMFWSLIAANRLTWFMRNSLALWSRSDRYEQTRVRIEPFHRVPVGGIVRTSSRDWQ
jgi:hypothetical protein